MFIQPNYTKLYAGLFSTAAYVLGLAVVVSRFRDGHWPLASEAAHYSLILVVVPVFLLSVPLLSEPKRIEWSEDGFQIQPRWGASCTFRWSQLLSFGTGEGKAVFVIRFAGHRPFHVLVWAFNADSWRAFKDFLATVPRRDSP